MILAGSARDGQDDAGALDREADARAFHFIQRGAIGDRRNPRGDDRGRGGTPSDGTADDPLRRRNPSLQQGPAGRVPPRVEAGDIVLIGATTENPSFEVNSALLSRSKV